MFCDLSKYLIKRRFICDTLGVCIDSFLTDSGRALISFLPAVNRIDFDPQEGMLDHNLVQNMQLSLSDVFY